MNMKKILFLTIIVSLSWSHGDAAQSRIKDVAKVVGLSDMQVIGYGVVTGLDGSGDRNMRTSRIASQSVTNLLERFGLTLTEDDLRLRNVAAVMVTANIPPFIEAGEKIDVSVSSLGDASSLEGGTLLLTPLASPTGEVWASAQGALTVGGFNAESGFGDRIQRNHTLVGLVENGGTMAQTRRVQYIRNNELALSLNNPDFATTLNVANTINQQFGEDISQPLDQATISITIPQDGQFANPVAFIARLETLMVEVDVPARVVINERTGTIVVGTDVRISEVAISHGNITVQVQQTPLISQPPPFSQQGQTVVVPDAQIQVEEEVAQVELVNESVTVGEVANALNALGVRPRDLISIFQALNRAGALQAELVVM